jgi:hypothetical protein
MKSKPLLSIFLITLIQIGTWTSLAIYTKWKVTASPRSSFSFLIKALKANDINGAKSVMTPDCVERVEGLIREPGWRTTALGLRAKKWHLENSTSTWPILRRWAEVVDGKETTCAQSRSDSCQITPFMEQSVTFAIAKQSYGRWLFTNMYLDMGN